MEPTAEHTLTRAQRMDRHCDEFEALWLQGSEPQVEPFLQRAAEEDRAELRPELLAIDEHYRRLRGAPPNELLGAAPVPTGAGRVANDSTGATAKTHFSGGPVGGRSAAPTESSWELPGYEILGEIGRGSMGVVYRARQKGLGRIVAVKVLLSTGHEETQRFQAEAAAIARLHHPNCVQIYAVGVTQGRPFLTLELLEGGTLAQHTAGLAQPPRNAARLIETLARAIHEAHQAGIVHRDLKPANILLSREGVAKISDFGLAKQVGADYAATASGMLLGTPRYMAPEQAAGQGNLAGPAADIYALGAILYELLTGRPPFEAATLPQLLQAICQAEPVAPRRIEPATPRALEIVCLQCLEKQPARRYATAAELADDLQRFLADEPIRARPPGALYRLGLWCRRQPVIAGTVLAGATLLVTIAGVSLLAARYFENLSTTANRAATDAQQAQRLAEQRAGETRLELARARIHEARTLRRSQRVGQFTRALARLQEARDEFRKLSELGMSPGPDDWTRLRDEAASTLLVPDLLVAGRWPRRTTVLPEVATDVVHRRYVRLVPGAPQAEICSFGTDEPRERLPAPDGSSYTGGVFSAAGNHLVLHSRPDNQLHFWDVEGSPRRIRSAPAPSGSWMISDDGRLFVSGTASQGTRCLQVTDGSVVAETALGEPLAGYPLHPDRPWVALRQGRRVIAFDYVEQRVVWEQQAAWDVVRGAWSQDGRWLVIGSNQGALRPLAASTGYPEAPEVLVSDALGVVPVPAAQAGWLAATDWSGGMKVYDWRTGRLLLRIPTRFFDSPRVLGTTETFTLACDADDYVLWQPHAGRLREFAPQASEYVTLSPSGRFLAVHTDPGNSVYHLPSCERVFQPVVRWGDLPLGFTPDERGLLFYGWTYLSRIALAPRADNPQKWRFGLDLVRFYETTRNSWGLDHRASTIAVPCHDRGGIIYHRPASSELPWVPIATPPQPDCRHARVSPDGRWVVLGSHVRGKVAVYSGIDGTLVRDLIDEGGWSQFSPDGRWLAVRKFTGGGELFQVDGWLSRGRLPGADAAFSADGRWLVTETGESTLTFFETDGMRRVGQLEIQDQVRVQPCAFTPDSRGLIVRTRDNRRLLYIDLAGLRRDLQALDLDWSWDSIPVDAPPDEPIPEFEIDVDLAMPTPARWDARIARRTP